MSLQKYFTISILFMLALMILLYIINLNQRKLIKIHFFNELEYYKKLNSAQTELIILKQNIAPHFLFNSLSTLSALIEEQSESAVDFVGELANIYRYMVKNAKFDTIDLKSELLFIKSYIYVYQKRFGGALQISVVVKDSQLNSQIPPATLQLLIENAIKHNIVCLQKPLHITIKSCAPNHICVSNNKQLKLGIIPGIATGLTNIKQRYNLLKQEDPLIEESENTFSVKIILI